MRHPVLPCRRILVPLILIGSLLLTSCGIAVNMAKYTDVPPGCWYYDTVSYALEHKLVSGTSTTTFSPDTGMTRGQFITILRRALGASDSNYKSCPKVIP